MPTLSDADIQNHIDTGRVAAFTLDTNIFHRYGYDLESASLLALHQFRGTATSFVVSDIVMGEVRAHALSNATSTAAALKKAAKDFRKVRRQSGAVLDQALTDVGADQDFIAEIDRQWASFAAATSATVLSAGDRLDADKLVSMYFETQAPFEEAEEKKAEFPDAIALLELEHLGNEEQRFVLAVSKDGGWSRFAAGATWLIVVGDLPKALGFFHRADTHVAARAAHFINDAVQFSLAAQLDEKLQQFVENINPDIQASSWLPYEDEFLGASFVGRNSVAAEDVTIIDSDEESVRLAFRLTLQAAVEAEFTFTVRDWIDKDYVTVGGAALNRIVDIDVEIAMQVSREIGPDNLASDIEVEAPRWVPIDFGPVEPEPEPDPHDWD